MDSHHTVIPMGWGCLTFIILFPVGLFVWPIYERRWRKTLTPEELNEVEMEDQFGLINPDVSCIYCKRTGCVRTKQTSYYLETGSDVTSLRGLEDGFVMGITRNRRELSPEKTQADLLKAKCMNCGSFWDMFPPKNP